ncbi:MAG: formate dehydrogenase accessory sulfurtransferase FdhD [Candidatus Sericytochromatia bacterium]
MKPAGALRTGEVLTYQRGRPLLKRRDRLATEEPLEIRLITGPQGQPQSQSLTLTLRTPGHDYELAAGLLLAEGLIRRREQIVKMTYCVGENKNEQQYNVLQVRLHPDLQVDAGRLARFSMSTASCGLCGKVQIEQLQQELHPDFGPDSPRLDPAWLYTLQSALRPHQRLFERTGGVHAAGLFAANGDCRFVFEDVGRHNALDKLIGHCVLNGPFPLLQEVLLVSGRLSFELVQKSLQASIPVVAAVGAPSTLAVELAQAYGQTLIGFLKTDRFNVYSGAERIQQP